MKASFVKILWAVALSILTVTLIVQPIFMTVHISGQMSGSINSTGEKPMGHILALQTKYAEHRSWMEYTIGVYWEIFTLKDLHCTFGLIFWLWIVIGLYKWMERKWIDSRTNCF